MYKQVIVVRSDLGMSTGKLAAQVSHASLKSWQKSSPRTRDAWDDEGAKKVIVKVDSLAELRELEQKAKKLKLPAAMIRDAGHTELKSGTITCLGIGPDRDEKIDSITSALALV